MSTYSVSTMAEALDLTSTLVMGWILPVATTLLATSPRTTLESRLGSMVAPLARRTSATPATSNTTKPPALSQIQNFLLLRDAATKPSVMCEASPSSPRLMNDGKKPMPHTRDRLERAPQI